MIRHFTAALSAAGLMSAAALAQESETPEVPVEEMAAAEVAVAETATALPDWSNLPEPVDLVCPFSFDYEDGALSCGFITVPENRANPDSRLIRLHYVKIASTAEDEADIRPDPVLYLTGGPGVTVEGYAERLREHHVLEQRDLYILEQRGIGHSGDFCPHYDGVRRELAWGDTPLDDARNNAERMRECFRSAAEAGVDLTGYSTWENAHDVRDLRQALGFESWNVWGISYGSHLGQMVLNVDPEGTRAMVLDAIVPNDLTDLQRIASWANLVLENVFTTCADDPVCDGLRPRFEAALDELKANPIIVETDNLELYPEGRLRVGGEILLFAPFMMMYEQDEHPAIPSVMRAVIEAVETGDRTMFDLFASDSDGGGISVAQGMSSAIRCNDGYFAAQAEVIDDDLAANPLFQGLGFSGEAAAMTAQVCVDEGLTPRRGSPEYSFVTSDIPTLVINGNWDPVTPPVLAEYIAPGYSNGRLIIVPFAGHGPTRSMSECAGPVLNAFFDDLDPASLDAACLEEGVAEPEYFSAFSTNALLRAAVMADDDPASLAPAGLWAGLPFFILLIGLFAYPIAWFARMIDGQSVQDLNADTGGARLLAFATALTGVGFLALIGAGGAQIFDVSEVALLAGLGPIAGTGAWLGLLTGLLGAFSLFLLWRTQMSDGGLRIGTLLGMTLTGLSGVALATFAFAWDLAPF